MKHRANSSFSGFANAITNNTNPADSYAYYLPLGTDMPGGSRPTCNQCLKDTMLIYTSFASNKTQPLSQTYVAAAQQVNIGCGPNFVNATVATTTSGGMSSVPGHGALGATVALLMALATLLL